MRHCSNTRSVLAGFIERSLITSSSCVARLSQDTPDFDGANPGDRAPN